jgi:hypothetical protein
MHTSKITTALAVTALAVAVLGSTPLGHAAGTLLPRSSVGTPQLKTNAVNAAKIRKDSVTGAKVLNGSLTAADFKAGSLPAGPKGEKGDKGDPGPSLAQYWLKVHADGTILGSHAPAYVTHTPGRGATGWCSIRRST